MGCQICQEDGFFAAIILMACLHGILLASILLLSKQLRSRANICLAFVLLEMSIMLAYEFSYYVEFGKYIPLIFHFFPYYIVTIIPVGIFYFVIFLIQPEHKLNFREKLPFIAIGLDLLVDILFIPLYLFIENPEKLGIYEIYLDLLTQVIGLISSLILLPWALRRVKQYQTFLYANYSTTSGKSLAWLRNFLLWLAMLIMIWLISFIQQLANGIEAYIWTYEFVTLGLIISLFWAGYFVILKSNWFQIVPFDHTEKAPGSEGKLSVKTSQYHEKILALMKEESLYENPELTLDSLSKQLDISSGYVSRIINEKEGKNFFEFVNTYRIEAVKERLMNPSFSHYSIMGIALECGFKSKSTFNAVFKKFTGYTPSAFKRSQQDSSSKVS